MLAYALASKPCSEATDIGDILSGGSGCFNPANLLKDLGKKSGEIEVIREVKSFRIDTRLIRKKSILSVYYYRYSVLSKNIIHASVLICFQHTTTIIRVNPSKNNSTESQNLLAIPQITPTINSNLPSPAKTQPSVR